MSGSRQVSDGGRSEKSTFAQTCNLLSRYMKEKGSLRDLNLEIGGKVESLEAIVKSSHCAPASILSDKGKSNEQQAIDSDKLTSKENSQLTIFYSGRVLVFDECPADKAKEVIAFAKKQSSQMSYGITLGSKCNGPTVVTREGLPPRPHKPILTSSNTPQPEEPKDLPIARRSSLHRFLSKRKDRAAVRGPYQYHDQVQQGPASSSSSKGDEQLELRL